MKLSFKKLPVKFSIFFLLLAIMIVISVLFLIYMFRNPNTSKGNSFAQTSSWTSSMSLPEPDYFFELPNTFGNILVHLGSYDSGYQSEEGGIAEIIVFNPANRMMYVVNEQELSIDVVYLGHLQSNGRGIPSL